MCPTKVRIVSDLFPAYAGVIPEVTHNTNKKSPFPRLRGGDPDVKRAEKTFKSFSPPTRG